MDDRTERPADPPIPEEGFLRGGEATATTRPGRFRRRFAGGFGGGLGVAVVAGGVLALLVAWSTAAGPGVVDPVAALAGAGTWALTVVVFWLGWTAGNATGP